VLDGMSEIGGRAEIRRTSNRSCDLTPTPHSDTARAYPLQWDKRADSRYLNLCYGEPMFAKNPSLGEGNGPRPGTKECRSAATSFV
jgi:hypothetical protein